MALLWTKKLIITELPNATYLTRGYWCGSNHSIQWLQKRESKRWCISIEEDVSIDVGLTIQSSDYKKGKARDDIFQLKKMLF